MAMRFDETLRGVWFVALPESDMLACVNEDADGTATITYRFRYYNSPDPFDKEDRKNWYRWRGPDCAKVIEAVRALTLKLAEVSSSPQRCELLRGDKSLAEFMEEFKRQPFVHMKQVPFAPSSEAVN